VNRPSFATDAMTRIRGQERADAVVRLIRSTICDGHELARLVDRLPRDEEPAFFDRLQKRLAESAAPR
jgi:hypothetical protein